MAKYPEAPEAVFSVWLKLNLTLTLKLKTVTGQEGFCRADRKSLTWTLWFNR